MTTERLPRVEGFEIEALAGRGAMGSVYRAIDLRTGERVAVKTLLRLENEHTVRLRREAAFLAGLVHPHVVRLVGYDARDGNAFLAMEWLEGETLTERLERQPLTLAEVLTLGRHVADALGAAHDRGIVHRDIKPDNLLLVDRDAERVKVVDFGIARSDAQTRLTETGVAIGTPHYMAPEQARGDAEVGPAADVYALGAVLFRCLAGRTPFDGAFFAILVQLVTEDAPRLADVGVRVTPAVEELVASLVARAPESRPRAADVAARLAELSAAAASAAQTPAEPTPAITEVEQSVRCLLLARTSAPIGTRTAAVRARVAHGALRLEELADGSLLGFVDARQPPTDQALVVARAALALALALPDARISIVAGVRTSQGRLRGLAGAVAQAPGVTVDDAVATLLGDRFELRSSSSGVALVREARVGSARTLLGRRAPFVGRDVELATLDAAFDACVRGPAAHAVVVKGVAGVGKSRLREVFVERLRGVDAAVWIARGDPMRAGAPLGLLGQAIAGAVAAEASDPARSPWEQLRAFVAARLDPEDVARIAEFVGEMIGAPTPEPSLQLRAARSDAVRMWDHASRALEDLFRAVASARSHVIVLEDLHWGDGPSLRLVEDLLRTLAALPLFVLALTRPEVDELFPDLWARSPRTDVTLGQLSRAASEELVRQALGARATSDVAALILERADGNAFILEELVRAVADGRSKQIPTTVLAMVQARLDELADRPRRLLRAASVFGRGFWRGGALALLGLAPDAPGVAEAFAEIVAREIVVPRAVSRFAGDEELAFRHALIRDAAYASLTDEDRALGHRLAAGWLERAGERDGRTIADHAERGGDGALAATWLFVAAEQALEANDFDAVLAVARRAEPKPTDPITRGRLLLVEAEAHRWKGDGREAERCALAAMALLPPTHGDHLRAAAAAIGNASRSGHRDVVTGVSERVLELSSATPLSAGWFSAAAASASALVVWGELGLARRLFACVDALAPRAGDDPALARDILEVHWWRTYLDGDMDGSLAVGRDLWQRTDDLGDARAACFIAVNLSTDLYNAGELEEAEELLRGALRTVDRFNIAGVRAMTLQNLGNVVGESGRLSEGIAMEREAAELFHLSGDPRMEAGCYIYLSRLELDAGDAAAARTAASAALELPQSDAMRAIALAARTLAELALGAIDDATRAAEEARSLVSAEPEGWAMVALAIAGCRLAGGDREGARSVLRAACDKLRTTASRFAAPGRREKFLALGDNRRVLELEALASR